MQQKEQQELLINGHNGNSDGLDPSKVSEKSSMVASASSLTSLTSVSSAIPQTDESVILITSPYTNGLTVPAIMNPNATNSACVLAMPTPYTNLTNSGSAAQGEVSCSSMTSPPITPPQTGSSSTSYLPTTQLTSSLVPGVAQSHTKDISMPTSTKMGLPSLQTASVSPLQGNNYIHVSSASMLYPSPLSIPMSTSSTKPSYVMNQYSNNSMPQTFQLPTNHFVTKTNVATSPSVMSPPVTSFLDPQLMCLPTANTTLNDPTNSALNPILSPMFGSSGQNVSSIYPTPSFVPVIPGVSNGLDYASGSPIYPNNFLVSNDPHGNIQYMNVKNGEGYLSPGNTPSPFAYPPGNYPSPSAVHVTSDRSVYSTTLSDVSLF